MFTRRPSQKPSDDLYKSFRASFPQLTQNTALNFPNASSDSVSRSESNESSSMLTEALDVAPAHARPSDLDISDDAKDADATPRVGSDAWNFASGLTPSLMDTNSHSFNLFANQIPGYYTPTPGGTNTYYHNQAGDLHTPGFGIGLGTPLSMPTSEGALHAGQPVATFGNFQHPQHSLPPQQQHHHHQQSYQNINPYHVHHPTAFPPHHFSHQTGLDPDAPLEQSPNDDFTAAIDLHQPSLPPRDLFFRSHALSGAISASALQHPLGEKFRYHVTLNAPTAMVKHTDEIPITYLNKGQAYTLNVLDTQHPPLKSLQRYRTFVRVSFEDEQQRLKPAACWQLWKEGRGTNEAHQRGGRLQAVEYVEANGIDDSSKPRIDLESASFDGFCVTWTPLAGSSDCAISVRFNFLSTDFSHSKGVKGIPVRLCAKTEVISDATSVGPHHGTAEVCYCKVKLFRDHGAERKLSNDVVHVKKTIDKLNNQIAQIEAGMKDSGKRKRSGSMARINSGLDGRPSKMAKHRRTWSVTSTTSNSGGRGSAEDDLHARLMMLQDMFTSTRPASVLYLRGDDEDDPDEYPVKLVGGESADLDQVEGEGAELSTSQDGGEGADTKSPQSSIISPTPESSASPVMSRRDSTIQPPPPAGLPRVTSTEWRAQPQTATVDLLPPSTNSKRPKYNPRSSPTKIKTRGSISRPGGNWVEALDIDPSYQTPPDPPIKPIACFFVQPIVTELHNSSSPPPRASSSRKTPYYRAVYLTQRNVRTFVEGLSVKCAIEPTQVLRTLRVTESGLEVHFDDECVRELPEGQDIRAEFRAFIPDEGDDDISPAGASSSRNKAPRPKREWDAAHDDVPQIDGDLSAIENVHSFGYELRLSY